MEKVKNFPSKRGTLSSVKALGPLQLEPPSSLPNLEKKVWRTVIAPLIKAGYLLEPDYFSAVQYCELAVYHATELSPSQASQLANLRANLGMTPSSRLRLAPAAAAAAKESATIAEVLELHVS